jgi:hypothetical protein
MEEDEAEGMEEGKIMKNLPPEGVGIVVVAIIFFIDYANLMRTTDNQIMVPLDMI